MPTDQDRILTSRGQLVRYDFYQANLVPDMNAAFMQTGQDWAFEYCCPFAAEVAAVGWMYAGSFLTSGEVMLDAFVTGQPVYPIKLILGSLSDFHVMERGVVILRPGDKFGVRITTTSNLAPVGAIHLSLSLYATMYVD